MDRSEDGIGGPELILTYGDTVPIKDKAVWFLRI
jgi:hypothetical protein